MQVSLVLPAYNEADRIGKTINQTSKALKEITSSFEIIIAEDGSSDGTDKIASKLAEKYNYVRHLHSDSRLGKGRALTRAFKSAHGEVICFVDVDLATDMKHFKELIEAISLEGYDFAIGSRMMPQSKVKRPLKRSVASQGFNFLVRTLLHSNLYDHQCGFKAFKKDSLFNLIDKVKNENWFFDTELLVLAQHKGYKIKEFPVVWTHGGPTKVNLRTDILDMGSQIFHLWWSLNKQARQNKVKSCEMVIKSKQI